MTFYIGFALCSWFCPFFLVLPFVPGFALCSRFCPLFLVLPFVPGFALSSSFNIFFSSYELLLAEKEKETEEAKDVL